AEANNMCSNKIKQAQQSIFKKTDHACNAYDTTPKNNSPFVYKNPDGGCDLGLELPGLPTFGVGIGGLDLCKMAKTVTGGMVREVNKAMKDTLDESVKAINEKANEKLGTNVIGEDINIGDKLTDGVNNDLKN